MTVCNKSLSDKIMDWALFILVMSAAVGIATLTLVSVVVTLKNILQ